MESSPSLRQLALVDQLRPFVSDEAAYGRMYADFHDLLEACAWLLKTFSDHEGRSLNPSELEDLLVDIDVKFIEHVSFHLQSLHKDLTATLENFPDQEGA